MAEDCVEWPTRYRHGYGRYYVGRGSRLAHRVAWELAYGPIPAGMLVLHHCDNPPCVRPSHLFLGTDRDNNIDKSRKGRVRGRWPQVLSAGQVAAMRLLAAEGVAVGLIARLTGAPYNVVHSAVRGRNFKWLTDPPPVKGHRA